MKVRYVKWPAPPKPYDCGMHQPSCASDNAHVERLLRIPDSLSADEAYGTWLRQMLDETAERQASDGDWLREMYRVARG